VFVPKLLLIQPPIEDFYDTDIRLQPIGLCYLKATVLRELPQFAVRILDCHHGHGRKTITLPKDLAYLRQYYAVHDRGPFSSFYHYYRFGASYERIGEMVAAEAPDVVGISSLFSPYYREVLRTAEAVRAHSRAPILVGGSHVGCAPETLLGEGAVDFLIVGEGERPLVEFLKAWLAGGSDYSGVPNLMFRSANGIVTTAAWENYPIDELPEPEMSDLPPQRYLYEQIPVCMIVTSRGCPHRCAFCSVHRTFGRKYRMRSPLKVVEEMQERYRQGYRIFDFEDDNLSFDKDRFRELCLLIIKRFPRRDIELLAMNGVSHLSLDKDILQHMRRAGFSRLNLALVSADRRVLRAVQRPHRVEQFEETVSAAHALGFQILSHQILGLPGESLHSMVGTLAFLAALPVLIGVSIFYCTPGSPISSQFPAVREIDIFRSRSTAMAVETEQCGRKGLYTLFVTARILNFLKGQSFGGETIPFGSLAKDLAELPGRQGIGGRLLLRMLAERRLLAATSRGFEPLPSFDYGLFERVWEKIDVLVTQSGGRIRLP